MKINKTIVLCIVSLSGMITGCATQGIQKKERVFLDSTTHNNAPPAWTTSTKVAWDENGRKIFKGSSSVKGNERVSGCYDLAKMDMKEALLTEIAEDIAGRLDQAQQSLSEDAELLLGKVRKGEYKGRIYGLQMTDQYFDRYLVNETERVDCNVLGGLSLVDYNKIKAQVVDGLKQADPRLKEAITNRQLEFFENPKTASLTK